MAGCNHENAKPLAYLLPMTLLHRPRVRSEEAQEPFSWHGLGRVMESRPVYPALYLHIYPILYPNTVIIWLSSFFGQKFLFMQGGNG